MNDRTAATRQSARRFQAALHSADFVRPRLRTAWTGPYQQPPKRGAAASLPAATLAPQELRQRSLMDTSSFPPYFSPPTPSRRREVPRATLAGSQAASNWSAPKSCVSYLKASPLRSGMQAKQSLFPTGPVFLIVAPGYLRRPSIAAEFPVLSSPSPPLPESSAC